MKKILLPLAFGAAIAGVLWFFLQKEGRGRGAGETALDPTREAPEAGAADLAPARGPEASQTAQPGVEPRRVAETTHAGDRANFTMENARWVEVQVLLPAGIPPGDDTALLACSKKTGEPLAEWDMRNIVEEAGLGDGIDDAADDETVWARRGIPGSTTVRVPFHKDAPNGMVLLLSRYVYAERLEVDLSGDPGTVTLEGQLGAYLTGRMSIPSGAKRTFDADDFELELDGRPREGGFAFATDDSRNVRIADDLSFEMRAISAERKYFVRAAADGLVDYAEFSFTAEPGQHRELIVPFKLGATIAGRILAEDGRPVTNAEIEAESQGKGMLFLGGNEEEVDVEEDGSYLLTGIAPGKVSLRIQADGFVDEHIDPFEVMDGEELLDFDIILSRGKHIAGRVQWPDGGPAVEADVTVVVIQEQGWPNSVGKAKTNAEGAFYVSGLEEGPFDVRARRAKDVTGETWAGEATGVPPNSNGLLVILREPQAFTGIVRDDTGAPVEAFTVTARPVGSPRWGAHDQVSKSVESADGTFELLGVFPGDWNVTVDAEGFSSEEEEGVVVTIPHVGEPVVIIVRRAGSIAGVVVDPLGNPVADASVTATSGAEGPFGGADSEETETDDEGAFTIEEIPAKALSVVASHENWAASEPVLVDLAPGSSQDDVVIHLRVGATITGEVFDDEGNPDAGQNVGAGSSGFDMFGDGKSAVTDEAGRFVLEHVTPGRVVVSAMPSEDDILEMAAEAEGDETAWMNFMGRMRMETVEVADGEEAHVVLGHKAKDPVRVFGTITEGGEPVPNAMVLAIEEGGAILTGMKAGKADDNGRYELTLDRPGDFVFNVDREDVNFTGSPFYVDVPETTEYEVDLAIPLGRITGVVTGSNGAPAEGIPVRVSQSGGIMGLIDLDVSSNVVTKSDGTYAFEHLRPGTYTVYAAGNANFFTTGGPRYGAAVVDGIELAENATVDGIDIRLSEAGKLAGVVRDAGGVPVSNASIFVRDAKGRVVANISTVVTDAAGRFTYDGLSPGPVTVVAQTDQLVSSAPTPVDVVSGETSEVTLEVQTGTYLAVTLLEDDVPVRARVQVLDEHGHQVNGLIPMALLQELFSEGFSSKERRIGPVPPGKYTLIATLEDGKDAKKTVRVKEGQGERKVKLRLK